MHPEIARALAPFDPPCSAVHQCVSEDDLLAADRALNVNKSERIQSALLAKDRPSRDGWKCWLTLMACVLVFVLTAGCSEPTEIEAERATAAALQDAIAQAQAERPDLWTPETIERAETAALIAAAGRK